MAYWTVATQIAITVTFSIATHRKKEFTVWHYTITPMTKISILTIFRAKSNIDTKRLWQKSSEKIAQFLLLLLKGVYDGYSNDNVKKAITCKTTTHSCTCTTLYCTFPFRHCRTTTWKCLISGLMKNASKRRQIFLSLGITHSLILVWSRLEHKAQGYRFQWISLQESSPIFDN